MDFTFGIITGGDADNLILKIIESIEQQNIPKYEIIIVGNSCVNGKNTRVIGFDDTLRDGWITNKKNIISQEALYENIVLLHDYISFDKGWYDGFLEFGNDFQYCVTKIKMNDEKRFRDYLLHPSDELYAYTKNKCFLPYTYVLPTHMKKLLYISGAYYIIKRNVALKHPLNELLLHCQAEDVEYSQRLSKNNIYIDFNQYSSVTLLKDKSNAHSEELVDLEDLQYLESLSSDKIDEIAYVYAYQFILNKYTYKFIENAKFNKYSIYSNYVEYICKKNDLSNFKNHLNYTYMLEHETSDVGNKYLKFIRTNTKFTIKDVNTFCKLNDSIGNPNTIEYGIVTTSPTTLRYIYTAHLILTHFKSLNLPVIDIVEIGGGYGGLCLAIHHFSEKYNLKINSYKIIDLAPIIKLQQICISKLNPNIHVEYIDSITFGSNIVDTNLCLVSTYCFSEISPELQKSYISSLFPKISHGFIEWTTIAAYDFGYILEFFANTGFKPLVGSNEPYRIEDENPNTQNTNKIIYF